MTTVSRPTKVRIGPYEWSILYSEKSFADAEEAAQKMVPNKSDAGKYVLGMTYLRQTKIVVRASKAASEDLVRETLLHEIMHACYLVMGWPHSFSFKNRQFDIQEFTISMLSPMLFEVLRDNPKVREWLFQ